MMKKCFLLVLLMFKLGTPLFADEPIKIPQGEWWEDNRLTQSVYVYRPNDVLKIYSDANQTVCINVTNKKGKVIYNDVLNVVKDKLYILPLNNEEHGEFTLDILKTDNQ